MGPWKGAAFVPSALIAERCFVMEGALSQNGFFFIPRSGKPSSSCSVAPAIHVLARSVPSCLACYRVSSRWTMVGFTDVLGIAF